MSQEVTYADVKFVRTPLKKEKNQQEDASDGENTYANIKQTKPGKEVSSNGSEHPKDLSYRASHTSVALVVSCLFLLATTIGFGVSYGRISQKLQEASQSHAANSSLLEWRIHTEKSNLAQSQQKLRKAEMALNSTLWECWSSGNKTERQLQELEEELSRVQGEKEAMERRMSRVQEERNHARSCTQTGCCPTGSNWKLFRWKCLWVSEQKKTWEGGNADCIKKSSQLLILKEPWTVEDLWNTEGIMSSRYPYTYWIGLKKKSTGIFSSSWSWSWMDGSDFKGVLQRGYTGDCVQMSQRGLKQSDCGGSWPYICEKPARPVATT